MATSAGSPDSPNEDFAGVIPNAAVLLDGAGISGIEPICCHGVAWYTCRLGGLLLASLSRDDGRDLATHLAEAIEEVTDAHRVTCDVTDPSSPSATVVLLRVSGDQADYLLLGDSVLVLDHTDETPLVVADRREPDIARPFRATIDAIADDTPERERALHDARTAFRARRNQPGGFWVAKDNPAAVAEALTGSRPLDRLDRAVLLSNGASRIVDRFGLADWPEVLAMLDDGDPSVIIEKVREAESGGTPGASEAKRVASDDATVAYCTRLRDKVGQVGRRVMPLHQGG